MVTAVMVYKILITALAVIATALSYTKCLRIRSIPSYSAFDYEGFDEPVTDSMTGYWPGFFTITTVIELVLIWCFSMTWIRIVCLILNIAASFGPVIIINVDRLLTGCFNNMVYDYSAGYAKCYLTPLSLIIILNGVINTVLYILLINAR